MRGGLVMPFLQNKIAKLPKWFIGTQEKYNNLKNRDDYAVYFIYDTGAIHFKDDTLNKSIILYKDGEKPLIGAEDRLYINGDTFEGWVYELDTWTQVLAPVNQELDVSIADAIGTKRMDGVSTMKIAQLMSEYLMSKSVHSMTWDEDTHQLTYKLGKSGFPIEITDIITKIVLDVDRQKLVGYNHRDEKLHEIDFIDNHIIGGRYDDGRKAIIFSMRDGSEVRLYATAMINIYKGLDTASMKNGVVNYIDGKNVITFEAKISKEIYNQLQLKEDGLYAESLDKNIDKIEDSTFIINNQEYAVPSLRITEFATEDLIESIKQELLEFLESKKSVWIHTEDLLKTSFSEEEARKDKYPTINLLNSYCGLKRL